MRKYIGLAAVVLLVAIIVPAAVAGNGNPPTIKRYQDENGNRVASVRFDEAVFITGDKLNTVFLLQCSAGKVEGKVQWWDMEFEAVSSKLIEAVPDPHCAGITAPVRGWYSLTSNIVGPDLTVTGNPF